MKPKGIQKRQFAAWALLLGIILFFANPFETRADEEHQFERMWPTLQQPWYFFFPRDMAIDDNGFVYVADTRNHRIQKFTLDGQFVKMWGRPTWENPDSDDGEFYEPTGIAAGGNGFVYVVDQSSRRVQKFNSDGQFMTSWETGLDTFSSIFVGIAVDQNGYVHVADSMNSSIQKYTPSGQLSATWGGPGSEDGKLNGPTGIAVDRYGSIYVADAGNYRIQKFTSNGQFVAKWGSYGEGDGEFRELTGVAVDERDFVYANDNFRIQKFTLNGQFIAEWGNSGSGEGEFSNFLGGVGADRYGYVYTADTMNNCIQKFTSNGQFVAKWGSTSSSDGDFKWPQGVAVDNNGYIYVADTYNERIQKFTSTWQFVTKWSSSRPNDVATDQNGFVYVSGGMNDPHIAKFTSDGQFIKRWGRAGSGNGQFNWTHPGIAVDENGYLYAADRANHRIQKFTTDGQFVAKWGTYGTGDGEVIAPRDVALDSAGFVYVVEQRRIQKFTSDGQFVAKWGGMGSGNGQFSEPYGIAVDSTDSVYVADRNNRRVQKFTSDGQFVTKWGELGSEPGNFLAPYNLAINSSGHILVVDIDNNRVQVFSQGTAPLPGETVEKAIIVAGGGSFTGNNIWDATQMCANFAYRALTYQGYTGDTIYYLSSDTQLDLSGDGVPDVDADATNSNFQSAITTWAQDAENLFIYMCDHGGNGTFRMGETELLQASALDSSLDTIQGTIPGNIVMVYDACRSGSFLPSLIPPSGKERILLTSASANEEAIFCSGGSVSFSFFFWGRMFNGDSFYDSYVNAKDSVGVTYNQTPQLEGNGNGIGNERADRDAARLITIGNETRTGADIPVIGSVSPTQTLSEETSALLFAANVIDADGISRVWAVITPPNYSPGSPDNPVTDLPILDLQSVGNNRYQATYASFTETGTYNVAIYAADAFGIMSLPVQTTVDKGAEPTPLNVSGFTTDLTGPTPVQTPVSITFTAQGDSGTLYYRYYQASGYQTQNYGNWQQLVDWTTDNSFIWFPYSEDHYIILAHVTDDPTSNNYHQAGLSIETSGNSASPIQITDFTTDIDYPQSSGTAISFDTTATGGSGTLYYRYYYRKLPSGQWTEIKAYDTDSTCTWTPPGDGLYVVVVQVTDTPSGSTFSTAGMTCTIGE